MSLYVVTRDSCVVRYDNPEPRRSEWLMTQSDYRRYYYYYRNCDCTSCSDDGHRQLIAYIPFDSVVSVSFQQPVIVQGRLLTSLEKSNLTNIKDWLVKRKEKGYLPWKVERNLGVLEKVAK